MSAVRIDGKELSLKIKDELAVKVKDFKEKYDREIVLAVVLVGEDPGSQIYVRNKIKACEYVGIKSLTLIANSSLIFCDNAFPSILTALIFLKAPYCISLKFR